MYFKDNFCKEDNKFVLIFSNELCSSRSEKIFSAPRIKFTLLFYIQNKNFRLLFFNIQQKMFDRWEYLGQYQFFSNEEKKITSKIKKSIKSLPIGVFSLMTCLQIAKRILKTITKINHPHLLVLIVH
jgi:hypothetical protein